MNEALLALGSVAALAIAGAARGSRSTRLPKELPDDFLEQVREIEAKLIQEAGHPCVCSEMTDEIMRLFPEKFSQEYGVYAGPGDYYDQRANVEGFKPPGYGHYWLRLRDGTIVDVTVTQFEENVARIIGPEDPRQYDYRPEWYPKDRVRERAAKAQQRPTLVEGYDEHGFFIPAASIETQVLSQRTRPGHKLWRRS